MRRTVEPWVPFEESAIWRIHDAYFAQRGPAAWSRDEVPSYATSNLAAARRPARLLAALVADLEAAGVLGADDPVVVLEPGAGSGLFAANFMFAVAHDPELAHLANRVRYVMADYAEKNLRLAFAAPRLAQLSMAGRLVAARFDARQPERLESLDQGPIDHPITLVITNYVCCVLPMHHLQRDAAGNWYRLIAECRAELPDDAPDAERWLAERLADATQPGLRNELELLLSWRPLDGELAAHLGAPEHAAALARVIAAFGGPRDAGPLTLGYPTAYFDMLSALAPRLVPGGAFLTHDFGTFATDALRGIRPWRPRRYGNSVAQEVNTALFDFFGAGLGWQTLRSTVPLESLHAALVTPSTLGPATRARFDEDFGRRSGSEDLIDHRAAARLLTDAKDGERALRYLLRAVELDEQDAALRLKVGEAALSQGEVALALVHLHAGHALDPSAGDFELVLGRAHVKAHDLASAEPWFVRALERSEGSAAWAHLGALQLERGDHGAAYRSTVRALELEPDNALAKESMQTLQARAWDAATASWLKG